MILVMAHTELRFNVTPSPRELISEALVWQSEDQDIALATLIHIEGNAPYPVGSQMLINGKGNYLGQITGGCAEQAIADQAVAAIKLGENCVQRYGLDSPFFDIKLPCGSGIDVNFNVNLSRQELQAFAKSLSMRNAIEYQFEGFNKVFLPNPRLIIFGQGPILVQLAQLALQTGFDVCCIAQNDDTARLLMQANLVHESLGHAKDIFEPFIDQYTAFISLFHEHELEIDLLHKALDTDSFYIGALGSRKTHEVRLEGLTAIGVNRESLERIHGPVGLDIGANTPAQIALSILADVTAHMNKSLDKMLNSDNA
jgi:xanthine dehydrogenase accessory factor